MITRYLANQLQNAIRHELSRDNQVATIDITATWLWATDLSAARYHLRATGFYAHKDNQRFHISPFELDNRTLSSMVSGVVSDEESQKMCSSAPALHGKLLEYFEGSPYIKTSTFEHTKLFVGVKEEKRYTDSREETSCLVPASNGSKTLMTFCSNWDTARLRLRLSDLEQIRDEKPCHYEGRCNTVLLTPGVFSYVLRTSIDWFIKEKGAKNLESTFDIVEINEIDKWNELSFDDMGNYLSDSVSLSSVRETGKLGKYMQGWWLAPRPSVNNLQIIPFGEVETIVQYTGISIVRLLAEGTPMMRVNENIIIRAETVILEKGRVIGKGPLVALSWDPRLVLAGVTTVSAPSSLFGYGPKIPAGYAILDAQDAMSLSYL